MAKQDEFHNDVESDRDFSTDGAVHRENAAPLKPWDGTDHNLRHGGRSSA